MYEFRGPYMWLETELKCDEAYVPKGYNDLLGNATLDTHMNNRVNTGKNLRIPKQLREDLLKVKSVEYFTITDPIKAPEELMSILEYSDLMINGRTVFLIANRDG